VAAEAGDSSVTFSVVEQVEFADGSSVSLARWEFTERYLEGSSGTGPVVDPWQWLTESGLEESVRWVLRPGDEVGTTPWRWLAERASAVGLPLDEPQLEEAEYIVELSPGVRDRLGRRRPPVPGSKAYVGYEGPHHYRHAADISGMYDFRMWADVCALSAVWDPDDDEGVIGLSLIDFGPLPEEFVERFDAWYQELPIFTGDEHADLGEIHRVGRALAEELSLHSGHQVLYETPHTP
jgi:hypothetical protein